MSNIDSHSVKRLFFAGAHALNNRKAWINELNVFPVPDGDTGTNMTMTVLSACREVQAADESNMEKVCRAISSGALKGARGNSGVILSQLFRGFCKVAREKETLSVADLTAAMQRAVDSAYKAVMKPKEGTILTVARAVAEKAAELPEDMEASEYLKTVIDAGNDMLKKTPELLPVLKQAGVVDSGGQGLMVFLQGLYDAFTGGEVDMSIPVMASDPGEDTVVDTSNLDTSDIKFGYCTEFIIKLDGHVFTEDEENGFKAFLESIGDSIVCVSDEEVVKVHVHTNDPGLAIQKALTFGQLTRMKIDNMREEHEERLFKNAEQLSKELKAKDELKKLQSMPRKDIGFISVAAGDGLAALLTEVGVDYVINGGQTMNPSTEDILEAISYVNADTIFVFPNNKNIVMAADQAARMTKDKHIVVIPTGTVCEGISCMVSYMPGTSWEENEAAMNEQRRAVRTIEVTYAVRDTTIDGTEIRNGDYMAISGKKILANGTDLNEVLLQAVAGACTEETAVVTIYYGQDVTEEDAGKAADLIATVAADAEVEVVNGGQPVYYYFISVE
ncbi:MAG: DAK2 domain-containing protein [Lachnospiraceae bacterium]|nr:DAK2 domain-containing protein [Lachnospiraceae bacterium]